MLVEAVAPFRVSFVGGGTDLPNFFEEFGGAVISCSLRKYTRVFVRSQNGLGEYKFRVNWSAPDFADSVSDIKNPIARECLRFFCIDEDVEITTFSDIPANTGLASSSSFCVALVSALALFVGIRLALEEIAAIAYEIERNMVGRNIGKQDHYGCCFPGLNRFAFERDGQVRHVALDADGTVFSSGKIHLLFSGERRDASDILSQTIPDDATLNHHRREKLQNILRLVDEFESTFDCETRFGKLIHEGWREKVGLSENEFDFWADSVISFAISQGASGGKLLGAGGGGFILLVADSSIIGSVVTKFPSLVDVPFGLSRFGVRSKIINE